ncbi:hypothetical protein AVEN_251361-1, partial [Araneus ventricosus]
KGIESQHADDTDDNYIHGICGQCEEKFFCETSPSYDEDLSSSYDLEFDCFNVDSTDCEDMKHIRMDAKVNFTNLNELTYPSLL